MKSELDLIICKDYYNIINKKHGSLVTKIRFLFSCFIWDTSKPTLTKLNILFKNELAHFCGLVWEGLIHKLTFPKRFITKAAWLNLGSMLKSQLWWWNSVGLGIEAREQFIFKLMYLYQRTMKKYCRSSYDCSFPWGWRSEVTVFMVQCMKTFCACYLSLLCWVLQ